MVALSGFSDNGWMDRRHKHGSLSSLSIPVLLPVSLPAGLDLALQNPTPVSFRFFFLTRWPALAYAAYTGFDSRTDSPPNALRGEISAETRPKLVTDGDCFNCSTCFL